MVYHLGTHQLILAGAGEGWNLYGARIFFQKFPDKLIERKSGLEVGIFFSENSIALLRVNWYVPYIQESIGMSPPESQLVCPLYPRTKE